MSRQWGSLLLLSGCTTTPNNVSADYQLSATEQKALGNGIIQFFSLGLPNDALDANLKIDADVNSVSNAIKASIDRHRKLLESNQKNDNQHIVGQVVGSMNMNPTGLIVTVAA